MKSSILYFKNARLFSFYKRKPSYSIFLCFVILTSSFVAEAQVSGTVFLDLNVNGQKDVSEIFVQGVIVKAYDSSNVEVGSKTTSVSGAYSFTGLTLPLRIEFSGFPTGYYSSAVGTGSNSSVQFYSASSTTANLGLVFPNNYCQTNPQIVTPCYVESFDPIHDVMVKFSYTNTGTAPLDKTVIANNGQVGGLWGMAYSRARKTIYTSAVLKTHIPLGPGGLDAIYTIDPTTGSPNATPWLQLTDDLGIAVSSVSADPQYLTNTARGVTLAPQNDAQAFVDAGTVGIGDIDLSEDEKTLYVVNLYDKKLYAIDIATKTVAASYAIPNPGCAGGGNARPWAIGKRDGKIFVSVTCDGLGTGNPTNLSDNSGLSNLSATVYRLDGTSFTSILSIPLNYPRETIFNYGTTCGAVTRWKPWTNTLPITCDGTAIGYPTPLLSDIEFDDNGNMILGFIDRTGLQVGYANYGPTGTDAYSLFAGGDILKACKSGTTWVLENASTCANPRGKAIGTFDPDGYPMSWGDNLDKEGEFYEGDFFHSEGPYDAFANPPYLSYFPGHPEITLGGLVVVPNTGEVMSNSYDPVVGGVNYNTGGVITLNNTTGKRPRNGFEIYRTVDAGDVTLGKGLGFGDLEALCDAAPIEIGNRIWTDTNDNGIQDAGEAALSGITVTLCAANGTTVISTATTDANGNYYFSNAAGASTGSAKYGLALAYFTDYILKFPTTSGVNSISIKSNTGTNDLIDTDADATGKITFTTGGSGQNNHSFDVGYIPCSITATAVATDVKCKGGNDGAVNVTVTNGSGSQTYAWTNSTATTEDISGLTAQTYTVTITDGGCTTTATATVNEPATALTATCDKTDVTTIGGSDGTATVTASGGTGTLTYLWSDAGGSTTASISGLIAGSYTVTVTDANNCTITCTSIVGSPSCSITATAAATDVKCKGGNDGAVNVTVTNGSGSQTYAWDNSTATTEDISGLTAQTYTVTVTDGACTTTATATVNEPATALTATCDKTDVTTIGGSDGTATVTASGGTGTLTYLWSDAGGSTTASISGLVAGSYIVTVTDANNCTITCTSIVGSPSCTAPTADAAIITKSTCTSGTSNTDGVISLNNITNGDKYAYNTSGGTGLTYASATSITGTSISITGLSNSQSTATNYTVRIYNGDESCYTDILATLDTIVCCTDIVMGPIPLAEGMVGVSYTQQINSTGGVSPYSYLWFAGTTGTLPDGLSISSSGLVSGMPTTVGSYAVRITVADARGCEDELDPAILEILPNCTLPTNDSPIVTNSTCNGAVTNADASIVINGITDGDKYAYNTSGGAGLTYASATAISGGTISLTGLTNATTATTYTIRIYNASEDCYKDVQVILTGVSCACPTGNCYGVGLRRN